MTPGPTVRCAVRPGSYHDSVVLMRLQRALAALPGVLDAGVVMATPANLGVLAASGLAPGEEVAAGPHDLLIAVRAASDAAAGEALARVDPLLQVRGAAPAGEPGFRPRSLATALRLLPQARWVTVSVPGRHAAAVAEEALGHGRNVFLYSDNVSIEQELSLKRTARERGLLLLGPDCGTAVIGGVGLGFANRVRRGPVGLVGASGTGLQAVMSRVHALGSGISHVIGTGGRDLSAAVGGLTALQALDLLRRDLGTEVVGLISKPPAPEVAARLLGAARSLGKPVVVYFQGAPLPGRRIGNLHFAASLGEAAELAVDAAAAGPQEARRPWDSPLTGAVRGLFSGGTLAQEVALGLSALLPPGTYEVLDLGADEYTVGRLHPMIDQDLRLRLLRRDAADPAVRLLLLDVVLGEGAHADPAGELAPAIAEARSRRPALEVAALVVGTGDDPQDLGQQIATLERAGARAVRSAGELVELATRRFPDPTEAGPPATLEPVGGVINVGLESFYDSLVAWSVPALHVEWQPPAGGDEALAALLSRMRNA